MINSLYLALSGMLGHERGLNVIGNNVTNMNTLGFRGSTVSFADVFIGTTPNGSQDLSGRQRGVGAGLDASRSRLDFTLGQPQRTGGELDLALDGEGFFIVQDDRGEIFYTRVGRFEFVDDELMLKGQKVKVLTRDAGGAPVPLSIADLKISAAKATTEITFDGNLSPSDEDKTLDSITVFDSEGSLHTLSVRFRKETEQVPGVTTRWNITVSENGVDVGSGDLDFNGFSAVTSRLNLFLTLTNADSQSVAFEFRNVTSFGSSVDSDVQVQRQDGFAAGTITQRTFDAQGTLKLTYSNGQTADGPKLILAQIGDLDGLVQTGEALLSYRGEQPVSHREAGDDLKIVPGTLEGSNVNLTTEFSQLILMQRGYQASSQVMSTANDMLQQLFDLRGRR
jgi:flagellar hook protein FlgE